MSDLLQLFRAGCALFGTRVHAVAADQWGVATPCAEWDVATLVDHVLDEHLWVPPLVGGHDLATAGGIVESAKRTIGTDRAAAWDAAALDSQRAFGEPGALDRDVTLSRGSTPATDYIGEMIADLTIHGWDLGQAIGVRERLPDELVQFVFPLAERYSGAEPYFAPAVEPPDGATDEERLIALTGRRPR
jgi:uncharacterized protein (TIGR03086 family)